MKSCIEINLKGYNQDKFLQGPGSGQCLPHGMETSYTMFDVVQLTAGGVDQRKSDCLACRKPWVQSPAYTRFGSTSLEP